MIFYLFELIEKHKIAYCMIVVFGIGWLVGTAMEQRSYSREVSKMIFNNLENQSKELSQDKKRSVTKNTHHSAFEKSFNDLMEKKKKSVDNFHESIRKDMKKVEELGDKTRLDFGEMQKNKPPLEKRSDDNVLKNNK